ncbi:hypothetical protein KJ909_01440, partial [Patescibacteria group bacterium]|nr:hypothetical protein [Patescibacteria group bacterium]
MAVKIFWLLSVADSYLSACLVALEDDSYHLLSSSDDFTWETGKQSFTSAVDKAIFSVAEKISLAEADEPSSAAFILPPFWVSSEGKITPPKLEIVEDACKKLKLQPLGFIANDETIAEAGNLEDDFPASFIL